MSYTDQDFETTAASHTLATFAHYLKSRYGVSDPDIVELGAVFKRESDRCVDAYAKSARLAK